MISVDGVVRDVVYLGLFTRYLVEIEGGSDLVVVEQNLKTTSMDVLICQGTKSTLALAKRSHQPRGRLNMLNRVSTYLYQRPRLILALLLGPPMLYMLVVYLGSLFALLVNSFFSLNEFTGLDRNHKFTLSTYLQLFSRTNLGYLWPNCQHGHGCHHRGCHHRLPACLLHCALCFATPQDMALYRGDHCHYGRVIWCASMPGS